MRHPHTQKGPAFEGYFPERDALQQELDKLNQVIRSNRKSETWKKFSLSTSNDEYGGVSNLSRKERERGPYYNPWYQSSGEIGKYFRPIPKKDLEKIQQMLSEQKSEQQKTDKDIQRQGDIDDTNERSITPLPSIDKHRGAHHSHPTGERGNRAAHAKQEYSKEAPESYRQMRQDLRTGPVKTYMTNPMGRLWKSINDIPAESGRNKRSSPPKTKSSQVVQKSGIKLPPVDGALRFGIGKSMGLSKSTAALKSTAAPKSTAIPSCSHDLLYKDMSIPSANSKGSSLN